jgi:hypothetical protein
VPVPLGQDGLHGPRGRVSRPLDQQLQSRDQVAPEVVGRGGGHLHRVGRGDGVDQQLPGGRPAPVEGGLGGRGAPGDAFHGHPAEPHLVELGERGVVQGRQ